MGGGNLKIFITLLFATFLFSQNYSIYFDGDSDFIESGGYDWSELFSDTNPFSVSFWINYQGDYSHGEQIFDKGYAVKDIKLGTTKVKAKVRNLSTENQLEIESSLSNYGNKI